MEEKYTFYNCFYLPCNKGRNEQFINALVNLQKMYLIILFIYEAKVPNILWFQLLLCHHLPIISVTYVRKQNIFRLWTWSDKNQRHLTMRPSETVKAFFSKIQLKRGLKRGTTQFQKEIHTRNFNIHNLNDVVI